MEFNFNVECTCELSDVSYKGFNNDGLPLFECKNCGESGSFDVFIYEVFNN